MEQNRQGIDVKLEKRRLREQKELVRLQKELERPRSGGYLFYLLFIVSIVYIADEVASQIGTQMQSVIAQMLFAPVYGHDMAVARMSAFGIVAGVGFALALLYKPLSDRFGRKVFLVINTFGMGLGLLLISVSTNIPVYLLGSIIIAFFIPNDMQAVYILESTPANRRASIYAAIKAVATIGMMLIPVLRSSVMGADIARWRFVYLIPALIAAAVAAIALFAVRETEPFLKRRIAYLNMSEEEREAAKRDKGAEKAQGGILPAVRFCFGHKQLRWLLIGGGFMMWGGIMTSYYETTMTYGYAAQFLAGGASLAAAKTSAVPFVTQALFLFPVGSALFQLLQGFLSDGWGRKPTAITMCACAVTSFLLFYFGANKNWNPYLVGFFCGGAIGSYWAALDIVGGIMCSESTPTNLRSSVLAVQPLLSGIFAALALLGGLALINIFGDAYAGLLSLGIAVPGMVIGLVIISFKVRETRHVDLEKITGHEA